jgi:hypothetical protein
MMNWKKIIPEGKYRRVKEEALAIPGVKIGSQVSEGWGELKPCTHGHILGGFFYAVEHTAHGVEYFRYRIMEVSKYAVDTEYKQRYTHHGPN